MANIHTSIGKYYVRDPVHDLIEFGEDPFEQMLWKLVQTSNFQRLRRIRQLGFCELVYPGATHNRLEHSLGVFNNARRLNFIAKQQLGTEQFDQERAEVSMAAALLHDIGHGPFSHSFEALGKSFNLRYGNHEAVSDEIIRNTEVAGILNDYRIGLADLVADMIAGKGPKDLYSSIVSSLFDADRLDYIIRDQLMSGSKNSIFDLTWLLSNIEVAEIETTNSNGKTEIVKQLVFDSRATLALQTYILGLFNLYRSVYFHKSIRSAEHVFLRLISRIFELVQDGQGSRVGLSDNNSIIRFAQNPDDLDIVLDLDDFVFWGALPSMKRSNDPEIIRLATMLRHRNLPDAIDIRDVVYSQFKGGISEKEFDAVVKSSTNNIEQYLQQNNLNQYVWLDSIQRPPYNTRKFGGESQVPILIKQDGEFVDLKDISGAVNILQPFKVDRVYVDDVKSEVRDIITEIIQKECKNVS